MDQLIIINKKDNVAVCAKKYKQGQKIAFKNNHIIVRENIEKGHKLAISAIKRNSNVIKYGYTIGHALKNIEQGEHVHVHNLKSNLTDLSSFNYSKKSVKENTLIKSDLKFLGFRRKNCKVGIRNEIWVVPTVGCVNSNVLNLVNYFKSKAKKIKCDDVIAFYHEAGCSQYGQDIKNTKKFMKNLVNHPNAGGVLVVGLGCEFNNIKNLQIELDAFDKNRIKFLNLQSSENEILEGFQLISNIDSCIGNDFKEPFPISKLKIGLKCGGSDSYSGITANTLLGDFSDFLVSAGGTTAFTEIPEMFGAEDILLNRTKSLDTFNKLLNVLNSCKKKFINNGIPIYANPSPGNLAGGISTLEEKSLGCIQKCGSMPIENILKYGDKLEDNSGLNIIESPSNDLVSSSALANAGCHIVLFTTGRGTPFGTFVPTIKIASNHQIAEKKQNWIDFDAGSYLYEEKREKILKKFISFILKVANGCFTKNEINANRNLNILRKGIIG